MPNIHSNISFGLVNIPIIINPIIKNNDTSFNRLHKKCMNQVKYIKYCPTCKKDVKESEIVKGYEYEKDSFLMFTKEEFNKIKPENEKEIEIVSFISMNDISPYYFEKSYVLNSENKSKAYKLFCEALKKTKKVALAKTIIGNKFYYCVLRFMNFGILMTTLYFEEEINVPNEEIKYTSNEKELNLAVKLIESLEGKFEPEKYKDEYQNKIREAIDDKLEGKEVTEVKRKPKKQIDDLIKALEKSLKEKK